VGCLHIIFELPTSLISTMFNDPSKVPHHLSYVKWFTPSSPQPEGVSGLFKVSKSTLQDGTNLAEVIPISHLYRSVHLFPKFGPVVPTSWSSGTVLDECFIFYLNPFTDRHLYVELQK
jgi:hypothetical protein